MRVIRPLLTLAILFILVWLCGCSMNPNGDLSVGKSAHFQSTDPNIDVTLLSVNQIETDSIKLNMEFVNTGGNATVVDPKLVIKYDNGEHTWGYPKFTVKKDQKEFRTFDMDLKPESIALIRSKGAQVLFSFKGQEASWILAPSDFTGSSLPVQITTPDAIVRKNDLSLQLLSQADFSRPLTSYQIDNSQRVGDDFKQYAYKEAYMATGMDNTTPFSFMEGIFRFPPGNASLMVESYNSNLAASSKRYSAGGFNVILEKIPDLNIGDKGYAYRMKTAISTTYVAFFSKGDTFIVISVVHPTDGGDAFLKEVAQKAEKKIVV